MQLAIFLISIMSLLGLFAWVFYTVCCFLVFLQFLPSPLRHADCWFRFSPLCFALLFFPPLLSLLPPPKGVGLAAFPVNMIRGRQSYTVEGPFVPNPWFLLCFCSLSRSWEPDTPLGIPLLRHLPLGEDRPHLHAD